MMSSLRTWEICAVLVLVVLAVSYAKPQPLADSSEVNNEQPALRKKREFANAALFSAVAGHCRNCDFDFVSVSHLYELRNQSKVARFKRQASTGFDDATTVSECSEVFVNIANAGPFTCNLVREYVKCAIRVQGLHLRNLSRRFIREYEQGIEGALADLGIHCDLDVDGLIEDLRFARADTGDECVNVLLQEIREANLVECDTIRAYVKCLLRVNNLHRVNLPPQVVEGLEEQTEATLRRSGIFCDVRVQESLDQLRRGD